MTELANKISGTIADPPEIRSTRVHETDMVNADYPEPGNNVYRKRVGRHRIRRQTLLMATRAVTSARCGEGLVPPIAAFAD